MNELKKVMKDIWLLLRNNFKWRSLIKSLEIILQKIIYVKYINVLDIYYIFKIYNKISAPPLHSLIHNLINW